MASGLVAKKIALFEIKPTSLEQQCRLKRKHAIRRKKYRGKERRIVTHEGTSMIALSTSDEHLNLLKDSDDDASSMRQPYSSQFSASCSALFDLVSVESSESGVTVDDKTRMEIIPRSKRVFLKSGSIEKYSKRLNIIDIDIEIKIEKKGQRSISPSSVNALTYTSSSSCDQYEPLETQQLTIPRDKASTPPGAVTTDRIRLTASVDDANNERNVNYYCSNCSHHDVPNSQQIKRNYNNNNSCKNKVSSSKKGGSSPEEPLYENIFTSAPPPPVSLGAPPLPPKRLFGDSFTTNYSCLPPASRKDTIKGDVTNNSSEAKDVCTSISYEKTKTSLADPHKKENEETIKSSATSDRKTTNNPASEETKTTNVTECNPLLPKTTKDDATICLEKDDRESLGEYQDDEEPFYEDLYDYCNGSESGNEVMNPLLELWRDQLHSLEQNVEDEVEYCDCSTILALMNGNATSSTETSSLSPANNGNNKSTLFGEHYSLRSYEIYDDCFGVEPKPTPLSVNTERKGNNNGNNRDVSNDDDIGGLTKFSEKNINPASLILSDYIKAKVTKASTPTGHKVTSSAEVTEAENQSALKTISSSASLSSSSSSGASESNLLSVFPSLSATKTKLVERREAEYVQNETSSLQVIVENERNVSKSQNNAKSVYAYGMLKSNNSNSKPRFGGRPVIAHPMDDDEGNNEAENDEYQSMELLGHKINKKDDNEIFNKPLPLPPANASTTYESLYEEPIYGITNQLTATYSDNGCKPSGPSPGKRRSSAPAAPAPFLPNKLTVSKPGSTYSHSPSVSSGSTYGYSSGSVNEYGESGGSVSKYGSIAGPGHTVSGSGSTSASTATDGMSIYGVSDKLPPTPPSKFSSIAKTAGRRIAKKFLVGIRKTSKSSLDEPSQSNGLNSCETFEGTSPSSNSQGSNETNPSVTNSTNGKFGTCNGTQIRRPISRPSIPPPEPPKNECGTAGVPDKENNYSIYDDGKNDRAEIEDDFDDSDFYDSDSELIRNFVSQVQPIYSMEEEPLYQYYTYGISLKPDDDYQPVIPKNLGLTLDMLVPRVGQRTLWCELPGVVSSGILSILSDKQKQLQEAIFEILTSEVSYLKSLDVLITLFYKNEELIGVLTEEERGFLFGNIEDVRDCSQAFLSELLGKWEESWYIQEIGDIITRNTGTRFSVYKDYCRNKPHQDKTMQKLRHTRDEFVSVVKAIEEDGRCQMLQVDSFLMLPMQRITRLPLLVNAVIQRTAAGKEKSKCEEALKCLTNLVLSCNEAARESQDAEETMAILEKLEFTRGIRGLPDLGQFIMKGDFMKNPFDPGRGNQINWTFRKSKRTFYWLLLFSKQLLVARRKANGRYEIIDMTDPIESNIKALPNLDGVSKDFKHFFMLHFNRKETVYFLAARTNSEVERWKSKLDAIKPNEELKVEAIFPYDARRPDEMSFYVGDVIRVSQMQPDGWYFGTKLATGESGWFPGNYCCENVA